MRILIVNDDGINAPGLFVAQAIAEEVAGPDGEVWMVAPETERSGASHCVSYTTPMRVTQISERTFHVSGYPADCTIAGIQKIMPVKPDLVLSGVNRGHNVAEDAVYSGTIAGAKEGIIQGVRSVAMSQYYGPALDDEFAAAKAHGAAVLRTVLALPWREDAFYNVNFPSTTAEDVKGVTMAPQGRRGGAFRIEETTSPTNRNFLWLAHGGGNSSAAPDADCAMCADGWITVTPMRPDLTDYDLLAEATAKLGSLS
ncbi:MAG: 5'/3'-nucleotidase SurE [Pikeienuella sp.]